MHIIDWLRSGGLRPKWMPQWIWHHVTLYGLQLNQKRLHEKYDAKIVAADKAGDKDHASELMSEYFDELAHVDEAIKYLVTWHLIEQAERCYLPRPEYSVEHRDLWQTGERTQKLYLKPEPLAKLRAEIFKYRKERNEAWVPLGSLVVAVLSMLVALVAVLTKS